ncbi:MAG TPA: MFS transporter [Bacillota bacterium]
MKIPKAATADKERLYRRNACLSIGDAMFFMIMTGLVTPFQGVYLLGLGGTNFQVAWLNALPPLVTALCVLPATRYISARNEHYLPVVLASSAINRLFYLIYGLIPFVVVWPSLRPLVFILLFGLATIPGTYSNLAWTSMIGRLIPRSRRGRFFGLRNTLSVAISMIATLFGGLMLDHYPFPINFTYIFIIAFGGVLCSLALLAFTVEYDAEQELETVSATPRGNGGEPAQLQPIHYASHDLTRFYLATFLVHLGINMIGPILTIYHVRILKLDNTVIGLLATVSSLASVATYVIWGRLSDRIGNLKTMIGVIVGLVVFSAAYLVDRQLWFLILMNLLNGAFTAGFGLIIFNLLLEISPPQERSNTIAYFNLNANLSSFIAPLLGTALVLGNNLWFPFILAALIRIAAMVVFWMIGRPSPGWMEYLKIHWMESRISISNRLLNRKRRNFRA